MVTEQETLIYIEDKDKLDASVAANSFAHKDVKNRAYINTLGAELALKYLASEDIDIKNIHNIHSIKKILEEQDISDIMLPNIHIDVRVVFDENALFIPKAHFEYNLVPDIYLVFQLAEDLSHVKFLGFFEPKLINKNNANDKYYFIEKEKLNSPKDLKKYIETHQGNTNSLVAENEIADSERIIMAMTDNDISENDKKFLIKQLTKSAELRDKFIEYESFEALSYKAMNDDRVQKKEVKNNNETAPVVAEDSLADLSDLEQIDDLSDLEEVKDTLETVDLNAAVDTNKDVNNDANLEDIVTLPETTLETDTIEEDIKEENNIPEMLSFDDTNIQLDIPEGSTADENTPAISFDDISVKPIEEAVPQEEKFEDSMSFDDIETTENFEIEQMPEIDENASIMSLDDVAVQEAELPIEDTSFNETLSLDNIDSAEASLEEEVLDITSNSEEVLSLDNVDDINLESIEPMETFQEETLSLNEVSPELEIEEQSKDTLENNNEDPNNSSKENDDEEDDEENDEEEVINEENIEPLITEDDENKVDTLDDISEFMDDTLSLDDIQINEEPLEEVNTSIEDVIETPEQDVVAEEETTSHDSFGKNLLENLSTENIDDISIENLNLDENDNTNVDNISSNDLLSEVDDLLNSTEFNNDTTEEFVDVQENEPVINEDVEPVNNSENENIAEEDDSLNLASLDDLLNAEPSPEENQETAINSIVDENNTEAAIEEEPDNIGVLFNDTDPTTDAELDTEEEYYQNEEANEEMPTPQIPGGALMNNKPKSNKSGLLIVAALAAVIAAASAVMVFKPKTDGSSDIVEPLVPQNAETTNNDVAVQTEVPDNVIATNAPNIKKDTVKTVQQNKKQKTKELKSAPAKPKVNPTPSESYLEVNRLVWDVPSSLSYSPKFQNYLRTAGKSIKLSLSADLLLATEYAYTNQVKVNLTMDKTGNIQQAKVLSSSGSKQIDDIVLQSVKDTLNVVKPVGNEVKTPNYNLGLIIYF